MKAEHAEHDRLGHEQKLAEALGALVQQIDISEYRDRLGHGLKNNTAFIHAQAIVDEFGVSHEDICKVLDTCGDDMGEAARRLRSGPQGRESRSWTAGP